MDNSIEEKLREQGACAEALGKLAAYVDLLRQWNRAYNLIGRSTEDDIWRRHILDCAQLFPSLPPGAVADFGSGAGLPGIVLSAMGAPEVHLIESSRKKAQFLREAVRSLGLTASVHHARIEDLSPWRCAALTARALAPLNDLLEMMRPFLAYKSMAVLLKGAEAEKEIAAARRAGWNFSCSVRPSITGGGFALIMENISCSPSA